MKMFYGKAAVSVYRTDSQSTLFAAEVKLTVLDEGLLPAYREGDNSLLVATDTMKNFIHATALEYPGDSLEDFLDVLGRKFLATCLLSEVFLSHRHYRQFGVAVHDHKIGSVSRKQHIFGFSLAAAAQCNHFV